MNRFTKKIGFRRKRKTFNKGMNMSLNGFRQKRDRILLFRLIACKYLNIFYKHLCCGARLLNQFTFLINCNLAYL